MRLGCCGTLDDAAAIKAAGFDFLEVGIQAVLRGDEPSATWDKSAPDPKKLPLPIEAANGLIPASRPIVGPQRDLAGLQDYMQRVAKRGERLGLKCFVFGSGGARKKPDGVDDATAWSHLVEFTRMAGEVCAHHGITLVIEHLNKAETNTLNSLADSQRLCEQVDLPSVQMLVDSYHYGLENETDDAIVALDGTLRHVHVAEVVKRIEPGGHGPVAPGSPAFDFDSFFCTLRKIGYDGRISIECGWSQPVAAGGARAAKFLRDAWRRAGECEV
jgi:sugar phosphate isomerase/epimerase